MSSFNVILDLLYGVPGADSAGVHIFRENGGIAARGRLVCRFENRLEDRVVEAEGRGETRELAVERMFEAAVSACGEGFRCFGGPARLISDATDPTNRLLQGPIVRGRGALDFLLDITPDDGIRIVAENDGTACWVALSPGAERIGPGSLGRYSEEGKPQSFNHEWPVAADLARPARDDGAIVEEYRQRFLEEINPEIADPFLPEGDPWLLEEETEWLNGSEAELDRLIQRFAALDELDVGDQIWVECDNETRTCHLDTMRTDARLSPRFHRLLDIALQENFFVGVDVDYTDGAHHRQSGWSRSEASCCFIVAKPSSAHQRIPAMMEIRAWLATRVPAEQVSGILAP